AVIAGKRSAKRKDIGKRLHVGIVPRSVMAHGVAVDQVNRTILPAAHQQVRMGPRLIRQQHKTAGAEVEIIVVDYSVVVGREIIQDSAAWVHLDKTIAKVKAACVGVE